MEQAESKSLHDSTGEGAGRGEERLERESIEEGGEKKYCGKKKCSKTFGIL